ncbi:MAG: TIGR03936 family radical SAM-associated protein [Alkalispirochaeta sp.]
MRSTPVNPERDLFSILNHVDMPARYVGGEFGSIVKSQSDAPFRIALSFPDLYEIGMSNTAVKLLYGMLNAMEGVACERVFVPAPDFERELAAVNQPLYTLETGAPVREVHLVAISYGYELLATNVLTLLKSSGMAVVRSDRTETDPIVVLGGPGATNPMPLAPFVDGVFSGEAEAALPELVARMQEVRGAGGSRSDYLGVLEDSPYVWTPEGSRATRRAIWSGFGHGAAPGYVCHVDGIPAAFGAGFPVPNFPVIQDHGPIEIMRGCPQGCRFCHAGVFYRPYRMKPVAEIISELDWLVTHQGYRDITFSSLSSGDYSQLIPLLNQVNRTYRARGISFQLPSLRINSVTLPIFEQLSQGKRSGLTFAVEAAHADDQRAINKLVPLERTIEIAREAFSRGWKHAKLYFMIGLPLENSQREAQAIVEYVRELRRAVKMEFVVNVGTFVPKPHTPFQWDAQLASDVALERIAEIRRGLPKGTRLRAHDPWMSWLEGVLTRGDTRTGIAIARAHERGARLDAWSEHLRRDVWEAVLAEMPEAARGVEAFSPEEPLPWDGVDLGITESTLRRERQRAKESTVTERCLTDCEEPCGVCNRTVRAVDAPADPQGPEAAVTEVPEVAGAGGSPATTQTHGTQHYLIVRYRKRGAAAFIPHLGLVRTFERVWQRLGIPLALTEGYHPKARMSFGQPLPLGVESDDEIVVVSVQKSVHLETDYPHFTQVVPCGLEIISSVSVCHVPQTPRVPAPMQRYGGSVFRAEVVVGRSERDLPGAGVAVGSADRLAAIIEQTSGATLERSSGEALEFSLAPDAPGLGRIIKEHGLRGAVRFRRIRMLDQTNTSLFGYYEGYSHAAGEESSVAGCA